MATGTIFGIINKKGAKLEENLVLNSMKTLAVWNPDKSGIWSKNDVAFGHHLLKVTEWDDREMSPYYDPESECCITADCRIDYRDELAQKLGIEQENLREISDSQLILNCYIQWGKNCLDHLIGDFAFAIWDERKKELFCARDHIGCRPFYYFEDDSMFAFSTNMNGFVTLPFVRFIPDQVLLFNYFASKALPKKNTFYSNISRLQPAHSMVVKRNGRTNQNRYWKIEQDHSLDDIPLDEAIAKFRELFWNAVRQRIRDVKKIGIELSGGIDSSSVAAVSREIIGNHGDVHAYTNCLSQKDRRTYYPFYDEKAFAQKMADYAKLASIEEIDDLHDKGSLQAIMDAVRVIHAPVIQLYPVFSDLLLERSQSNNIHLLLSGFGGDECVTNKATGIMDEYAHRRKWGLVFRAVGKKTVLSKIIPVTKIALKHLFRRSRKVIITIPKKTGKHYRNNDLSAAHEFQEPFRKKEKEWFGKPAVDLHSVRAHQYNRLMHESVSDRLENSYLLSQQRKIEYAYPMLDIKLIRFVYSLPPEYKFREGKGRYLIRRAMEGLLPDEIRLRNDKSGATIPNIFKRIHYDFEDYMELIEEGAQKNDFNYLDYSKLKWQLKSLTDQKRIPKLSFGPKIFVSAISLLILQKWQREGKIDTGIKC